MAVIIPSTLAFRGSPQVCSGYNSRMDNPGSSNGIYLDHAATTEVAPAVLAVMDACYRENSGNPSSSHRAGLKAREELEASRESILEALGAASYDLVFTSGGTEADNLAVAGSILPGRTGISRVLAGLTEHPAVLGSADLVERLGGTFSTIPVDSDGRIDEREFSSFELDKTTLVSVMMANNETGTLQPVERICSLVREAGGLFHTDAVQAVGKIPLRLDSFKPDLVSLTAHKIYGPKGVGALLVRRGVSLFPLTSGGGQENGLRSGTENVSLAAGFAHAVKLAVERQSQDAQRLGELRDALAEEISSRFSEVTRNTPLEDTLSNILNVSFGGVEGSSLAKLLDEMNVAVSTASACHSASGKGSHVLAAMGLEPASIRGAIRFSFGRSNSISQLPEILSCLEKGVERLRQLAGTK